MARDLYFALGNELRTLFKDLKQFQPNRSGIVRQQKEKILAAAAEIGGPIFEEAKRLDADVENFLKAPQDSRCAAVLRQHALRLEQETREL